MKLKKLEASDTSHEIICDSFLISEIASFEEIKTLLNEYKEKYKDSSILISLDDLGQAQYTSMHSTLSYDLDDTDGYDLSGLDTEAYEDGEHLGYLSTKSEFFIREENFKKQIQTIKFIDACKKGLTIDNNEMTLLEKINKEPLIFLDKAIIVNIVPVKETSLAISAFPNGYFSCDLNPFENYALSEYLRKNYGYELFGIGASLIAYKRTYVLDKNKLKSLGIDLARLYNREDDEAFIKRFISLLKEQEYLFLKYIDYFE